MLKVLISDDEIKVCKLIECLIDWNSLGLEIVGVVHDGVSALNFIKEHPLDIIITDIRMPEINGLELIQQAKQLNENLNFIIISGYNQFDYAQQAIKFGVEDYILKPIKKKELTACLVKIVDKREALEKTENEKVSLLQRLNIDQQKVKTTLLTKLITNTGNGNLIPSLEYVNTHYYCNFNEEYYQIIIIQPIFEKLIDTQLFSFLASKIKDLIAAEFHFLPELIIVEREEELFCLFNGSLNDFEILKNRLNHLRNTILNLQEVVSKMKIYIFSSTVKKGFEQLYNCMEEAVSASYDKLITRKSMIEYKPAPESPLITDIITASFRKEFLLAIETINAEKLNQLIEMLIHDMKTSSPSGHLIYDVYTELLNTYAFGIKSYGFSIDYTPVIHRLRKDFYQQTDLPELMNHLLSVMNQSLLDYQTEKEQEVSRPIRLAKQYINANYRDSLTLDRVGNEIGLNPTYFSSLFKKETGDSFIDYLNDVRIENAKPLLLDRTFTLIDICEMVGFNDIKYFKKRFKKSTGLSPTDYRKLYS